MRRRTRTLQDASDEPGFFLAMFRLLSWIMFFRSLITQMMTILVGCIYPAYGCFKAMKSGNQDEKSKWLAYWLVFGVYALAEFLLWPLLQFVPFYYELKLALYVVLLHPRTNGAARLYRVVLQSVLEAAEQQIDHGLQQADSKVGPHVTKVADKVAHHLEPVLPDQHVKQK